MHGAAIAARAPPTALCQSILGDAHFAGSDCGRRTADASLATFMRRASFVEQRALAFDAPAIAGERAVVAHHPMARDRDGDAVRRAGLATARTALGAPIRRAISA